MKNLPTASQLIFALMLAAMLLSGCATTGSGRTPASTLTALKAVNDQVEEGNIELEGSTDTAPPP